MRAMFAGVLVGAVLLAACTSEIRGAGDDAGPDAGGGADGSVADDSGPGDGGPADVAPPPVAPAAYSLDVAVLTEDAAAAHVRLAIAGVRTDLWFPVSTVTVE